MHIFLHNIVILFPLLDSHLIPKYVSDAISNIG